MKIKKLHIKNFKSLVDLEIVEPNPFTVFVGANGVGKSNIFEALEFYLMETSEDLKLRLFGGDEQIRNAKLDAEYVFNLNADVFGVEKSYLNSEGQRHNIDSVYGDEIRFSRIFIGKENYQKINYKDSIRLSLSASNLENVLKRLLQDENKRIEIVESLQFLIPDFENVEVLSSTLSGSDTLLIYEKYVKKPFIKDLISDGTFNLICLLTAIYQSDEPQFLCIEEPENGLTPDVIKEIVLLFRNACEEKGHYIWLNTHSQTLVSQLTSDEIITVDKVKGETKLKQFKGKDFHGLRMDEAWLTNSLGSGLPW